MISPNLIVDCHCHNAEGILWHPFEQRLYWTDIPTGRLFRYDPNTEACEQIYSGAVVGGFTIQADGSLLLFQERGAISQSRSFAAIASWRNGELEALIEELPRERDTRFNDVIADPMGRVFCGTMPQAEHPCRLYRLDLDGSLTVILENLTVPNGMGFTPDCQQFYFTNSDRRTISRFDYDSKTGNLSSREVFVTAPEGEGVPDGLTVDAQGYVGSARWNGEHLFRYNPDGVQVLRLRFPAKKVTNATFGGANYDQLYVSTAGGNDRPREGEGPEQFLQLQGNFAASRNFYLAFNFPPETRRIKN